MKPSRPLALLAIIVVCGALSYGAFHLWDSLGSTPNLPSSAPAAIALIAVIVFVTALSLRSRIRADHSGVVRPGERPPKPLEPLQAARAAVLAKASSLVGSVVTGIYAGYGAYLMEDLSVVVRRDRAVICGYSVLAGLALIAAALLLEHILRVPPPPSDEPDDRDRDQDWTAHR